MSYSFHNMGNSLPRDMGPDGVSVKVCPGVMIHTDQTAMFLHGQEDLNRWSGREERIFLQEFLEFYNSEILTDGVEFHYETFYDFYSGYLTNEENKEAIERFWDGFNKM